MADTMHKRQSSPAQKAPILSPTVAAPAMGGRAARNPSRLQWMIASLMGKLVDVVVVAAAPPFSRPVATAGEERKQQRFEQYRGILKSFSPQTSLVLAAVTPSPLAASPADTVTFENEKSFPVSTLVSFSAVERMALLGLDRTKNIDFALDTDISKAQATRSASSVSQKTSHRELERWQPAAAAHAGDQSPGEQSADLGGLDTSKHREGSWDQFAENERRFGVKSNYDESLYTTRLDRSSDFYKHHEEKAQRLEKEILQQQQQLATGKGISKDNIHLMEERSMLAASVGNSNMDEEDRYGAVLRPSAATSTMAGPGSVRPPTTANPLSADMEEKFARRQRQTTAVPTATAAPAATFASVASQGTSAGAPKPKPEPAAAAATITTTTSSSSSDSTAEIARPKSTVASVAPVASAATPPVPRFKLKLSADAVPFTPAAAVVTASEPAPAAGTAVGDADAKASSTAATTATTSSLEARKAKWRASLEKGVDFVPSSSSSSSSSSQPATSASAMDSHTISSSIVNGATGAAGRQFVGSTPSYGYMSPHFYPQPPPPMYPPPGHGHGHGYSHPMPMQMPVQMPVPMPAAGGTGGGVLVASTQPMPGVGLAGVHPMPVSMGHSAGTVGGMPAAMGVSLGMSLGMGMGGMPALPHAGTSAPYGHGHPVMMGPAAAAATAAAVPPPAVIVPLGVVAPGGHVPLADSSMASGMNGVGKDRPSVGSHGVAVAGGGSCVARTSSGEIMIASSHGGSANATVLASSSVSGVSAAGPTGAAASSAAGASGRTR